MQEHDAAAAFGPPDANGDLVGDEPDFAFGEIDDDDIETPDDGEPD